MGAFYPPTLHRERNIQVPFTRSGKSTHISMIINSAELYQHHNRRKLRTSADIAMLSADVAALSVNVSASSADIVASNGECFMMFHNVS